MARARLIVGVALCLVGAVWSLQGIGWLKGSFMTGETTWLMIGAVCIAVGAGLIGAHLRSR